MGAVLPFRRSPAPAPLDPARGSWVVAVTCRRWERVDPVQLEYQGCPSACALRWFELAAIHGMSGTFYQIMPVEEFERQR